MGSVPLYGDAKREYDRKWIAKRRADWLAIHGPCVDCESWEELEIDHIDRFTKVSHRVWSWSEERRDAELDKCAVRCRICHDKRTAAQLAKTICQYGHDMTILGYDNYNESIWYRIK